MGMGHDGMGQPTRAEIGWLTNRAKTKEPEARVGTRLRTA